jgi:hypothetical protein
MDRALVISAGSRVIRARPVGSIHNARATEVAPTTRLPRESQITTRLVGVWPAVLVAKPVGP